MYRLLLGLAESVEVLALCHLAIGRIQVRILANPGAVLGEQRQAGLVGSAQRLAVENAVQMPHR